MAKTNSVSEAFRELLAQLWRTLTGKRRADGDELDRLERELAAEAAAAEAEADPCDGSEADETDGRGPAAGGRGDTIGGSRKGAGGPSGKASGKPKSGRPNRIEQRIDFGGSGATGHSMSRVDVSGASVTKGGGSVSRVVVNGVDVTADVVRGGRASSGRRGGSPVVAEAETGIEADGVSSLDLQTRNGSVVVEATDDRDGRLAGTVVMRCGGADRAEAERRAAGARVAVEVDRRGRAVLRVEFPRASSDEVASLDGASFDLGVPALEGVTLVSSNGAVTSRGFAGTCTVRTSNGDVEVAGHSGDIDIGTSNGGVEVEHVAEDGSIRVETSNASIEVASGGGEVGLDLATSNDGVRVSLPAHWAGAVDARTSNDEITIETPDGDHGGDEGHLRVEIGGGGATARIRTSNGGVSVTVS